MKLKELLPKIRYSWFRLIDFVHHGQELTDAVYKLDFRKHKREWLDWEVYYITTDIYCINIKIIKPMVEREKQ